MAKLRIYDEATSATYKLYLEKGTRLKVIILLNAYCVKIRVGSKGKNMNQKCSIHDRFQVQKSDKYAAL